MWSDSSPRCHTAHVLTGPHSCPVKTGLQTQDGSRCPNHKCLTFSPRMGIFCPCPASPPMSLSPYTGRPELPQLSKVGCRGPLRASSQHSAQPRSSCPPKSRMPLPKYPVLRVVAHSYLSAAAQISVPPPQCCRKPCWAPHTLTTPLQCLKPCKLDPRGVETRSGSLYQGPGQV